MSEEYRKKAESPQALHTRNEFALVFGVQGRLQLAHRP
jgi:hypothetical protein